MGWRRNVDFRKPCRTGFGIMETKGEYTRECHTYGLAWIGSDRGRIGLGSARLGFGVRVRRYDFYSGRVRIGVGPIWLISEMLFPNQDRYDGEKTSEFMFFLENLKNRVGTLALFKDHKGYPKPKGYPRKVKIRGPKKRSVS